MEDFRRYFQTYKLTKIPPEVIIIIIKKKNEGRTELETLFTYKIKFGKFEKILDEKKKINK